MTGLGTVAWAASGGPDPVVIAVISASPLLLGSGTFSLLHGGARLRVHRALLRGESSDALRTSERLAGRQQLILGSGLLVTGLAFSMVGAFAGQGGGPRPVFMGVFACVGGASGASGFFMMEHAIYRVRFGRRGLRDPVAIAPTVRILAGGATLGLGGAI